MPRLFVDGVAGIACIHVNGGEAAVADPMGNLAYVLFHSALNYASVGPAVSTTLTLPERLAGAGFTRYQHTLFSHGKAGTPFVIGHLAGFGGVNIPLAGSVPVNRTEHLARWLSIGANGTHVFLNEIVPNIAAAATSITVIAHASDLLME